jgi:hypothetical protein
MKELGDYDNVPYKVKCECCKEEHVLFTQSDCCPEYYTNVYLRCNCGEYIEFKLPVN